tara:strand:- start:142 stop:315 length:174 start_codon:yes stop_codon:yes gene_type:complete
MCNAPTPSKVRPLLSHLKGGPLDKGETVEAISWSGFTEAEAVAVPSGSMEVLYPLGT